MRSRIDTMSAGASLRTESLSGGRVPLLASISKSSGGSWGRAEVEILVKCWSKSVARWSFARS